MHYICIFKAINNFQGTFCTYMLIKAMAPKSQAFSEFQRAVWGITAEIWQPSSNKLFFPALCLCVCMCVWNAQWADYISLPYLCGLLLQSPWHLDNKGHIWKSKSAQTPMLIYSYIYKREGEYLSQQKIMLNKTEFKLTVFVLHTQQAQMQLIHLTFFFAIIIMRDVYYYSITGVWLMWNCDTSVFGLGLR